MKVTNIFTEVKTKTKEQHVNTIKRIFSHRSLRKGSSTLAVTHPIFAVDNDVLHCNLITEQIREHKSDSSDKIKRLPCPMLTICLENTPKLWTHTTEKGFWSIFAIVRFSQSSTWMIHEHKWHVYITLQQPCCARIYYNISCLLYSEFFQIYTSVSTPFLG